MREFLPCNSGVQEIYLMLEEEPHYRLRPDRRECYELTCIMEYGRCRKAMKAWFIAVSVAVSQDIVWVGSENLTCWGT